MLHYSPYQRQNDVVLTTKVCPATYTQVREKAKELQLDIPTATDWLIRKGLGSTKIEPVKCTDVLLKSDQPQKSLDNIDARLSWARQTRTADFHNVNVTRIAVTT